jgi:hypothetical protein
LRPRTAFEKSACHKKLICSHLRHRGECVAGRGNFAGDPANVHD